MPQTRALLLVLLLGMAGVPVATAEPVFTLQLQGPEYVRVGTEARFLAHYQALGLPAHPLRVTLYVDDAPVGRMAVLIPSTFFLMHAFEARGLHRVHAIADEGLPTEARSPTILVRAAVPASPPGDLLALPTAGVLGVDLSWSPATEDGGSPIRGYRIERRADAGPWQLRATLLPHELTYSDAVPTIHPRYAYRVMTSSAVGLSEPAVAEPSGGAPPAPTVTVTPVDGEPRVVLDALGNGRTQTLIAYVSRDGGASWQHLASASGLTLRASSAADVDAPPLFRVEAVSLTGRTLSAPTAATGDLPGLVRNVTASTPGPLRVAWDAPEGGGPVQGYRVLVDGVQVALAPPEARSANVTTWPGTRQYTVAAASVLGDGEHSAPAVLTLEAASAPPALAATVTEGSRTADVDLAWTVPTSDGGAPITAYRIHRRTLPSEAVTLVGTTNASTLTWRDAGVADGLTYRYRVEAVTAAGPGAAASIDAQVEGYAWELVHGLAAFHVCELIGVRVTCTRVPSGGTYDSAGTNGVGYEADYAGSLTRRGVPQAGEEVSLSMWQEGREREGESTRAPTNATGGYAVRWGGASMAHADSCRTVVVRSTATDGWLSRETRDTLTICP